MRALKRTAVGAIAAGFAVAGCGGLEASTPAAADASYEAAPPGISTDASSFDAAMESAAQDTSSEPEAGSPSCPDTAQDYCAKNTCPPVFEATLPCSPGRAVRSELQCQGLVAIILGEGVDCETVYTYSASTHLLVGVGHGCNGFATLGCLAGPPGFVLPTACLQTWIQSGKDACASPDGGLDGN